MRERESPTCAGRSTGIMQRTAVQSKLHRRMRRSAETVGRLELVRGIPAQAGGRAGLVFARFDRTGAAATTDDATRIITVTLTVVRGANTLAKTTQSGVSATFALRNKSSF